MVDLGKPLQIRRIAAEETAVTDAAWRLLNRAQGDGLFGRDYVARHSDGEQGITVGAWRADVLVGVGCAELLTGLDYYLPFESGITARLAGERVGSLCTLAVEEHCRGQGIGQQLGRARLAWLRERGCTTVLAVSWLSGLAHTSDRVFEKLGFEGGKTVPAFYRADALKHPFDCPGCRQVPCACAARLYEYRFV